MKICRKCMKITTEMFQIFIDLLEIFSDISLVTKVLEKFKFVFLRGLESGEIWGVFEMSILRIPGRIDVRGFLVITNCFRILTNRLKYFSYMNFLDNLKHFIQFFQ